MDKVEGFLIILAVSAVLLVILLAMMIGLLFSLMTLPGIAEAMADQWGGS